MRLTWKPLTGTTVRGFIDRSIEETTLVGSSGYLRSAIGGSIEQEVRPDLYMNGHFYYSENDYSGVDRIDHVSDAGLGLKYYFVSNLYVSADYAFIHRISDEASADFMRTASGCALAPSLHRPIAQSPRPSCPSWTRRARADSTWRPLFGDGTLISAVDPRGGAAAPAAVR